MTENQNFISPSRYSRNGRLLEMRKNDVIEGSVTSPEMIKLIKETDISETDLKIIYPRHEPKARNTLQSRDNPNGPRGLLLMCNVNISSNGVNIHRQCYVG